MGGACSVMLLEISGVMLKIRPVMLKKLKLISQFYEDLQDLLELTPTKDVLSILGNWNTKLGSQEIPRVIGKFGLGVQMKQDKG